MRVYCSYKKEFNEFLIAVVKLVIKEYGYNLNIKSLEEIELVNKNVYSYPTDGRTIDKSKIIVTSRLYELLSTFNIDQLKEDKNYISIKKTLYHEMGHVNDMTLFPVLYNYGFSSNCKEQIASQFWLEYIAEIRTVIFENWFDSSLCDDFVRKQWNCTMSSLDENFSDSNFAYLVKVMPYFMAGIRKSNSKDFYISKIKNALLTNFIREIDTELDILEERKPFDDVVILYELYDILNKFYKLFMQEYKK
ncbi:hypothetical protein [Enterocloster clostridioformis]|uniref:Uncharacterized protein n=1 Tax=Enterocloster clostridioformis TaxID=1531 RepID=A0AAP9LWE0_9FIRM|nr:hypothetical protein [Enterocloster clostridioformis]EHG33218.1 hypothetical protein HMPREF9467_00829 [ [[Clostridium] clostridioforme 2_1_49FAA]QIX89145.1 hypothetical protein FOC47_00220 [Enterocloster clostridioformis]